MKIAACLSTAIRKIQPFETGNKRTFVIGGGVTVCRCGEGVLVDREGMLERAHRKVVEGGIGEGRLEQIYREALREVEKKGVLREMVVEE